jgi:ABC-2 type transport system ATP-binding protein
VVPTPVLVRDLVKTYRPSPRWLRALVRTNITHNVTALAGISFEVGAGEVMAVVGPNGAGKSTAFRVLVGLTTPSSGSASVMGFDCVSQSRVVRRLVGWMPADERSLFLRLSCAENLRFHGRLHGLEGQELRLRISEVLEMVGLEAVSKDAPFSLSAGMKARLQLARALLHRPKVIILDEPTGSVDPVAAHSLLNLITSIVERDKLAALISSHRLEEIEALHSHVVLLDRGAIRYMGDLDDLRHIYDRDQVELEFTSQHAAERAHSQVKGQPSIETAVTTGSTMRITMARQSTVADVIRALDGNVANLVHVRESRTPLRDILAAIYRGQTPE